MVPTPRDAGPSAVRATADLPDFTGARSLPGRQYGVESDHHAARPAVFSDHAIVRTGIDLETDRQVIEYLRGLS